ncbi:MAG: TlpA family protein disulfide reductase [Alphaproteobacteria bacterium]|nr:TlpA family protein disulfide reductase [Alphaproteobacteria bacterium]
MSAAFGRWAVLCLVVLAVGVGILLPPNAPLPPADGLRITGEIQHFRLLENPRPVPDVAFVDGAGKSVRLTDFEGKVVLLNFWATWCAPCRREMPALDRLQEALGGPKFQVVALSVDMFGDKLVPPYYRVVKLKRLGIYLDPTGAVQRAVGVKSLPTTVLIDARGWMVGALEGPAEWMAPEAQALIRHFIDKAGD